MKFEAKAVQNRLDAEAGKMRRDIDDLNALADQLCNDGQKQAAAVVRQMAGHLGIVHGLGRSLTFILDGETIEPFAGGK